MDESNLINTKLKMLKNIPSDINEHLSMLQKYSRNCSTITEFGVRGAVSTWAFLASIPKKITSYDIVSCDISDILTISEQYEIDFKFIQNDVLLIDIDETDLLFIDTLHTYAQLILELNKHANKVKNYIILHDTATYGEVDEQRYEYSSKLSAYASDKRGLKAAIEDFLLTSEGKLWKIKEIYTNNNGLTILERIAK